MTTAAPAEAGLSSSDFALIAGIALDEAGLVLQPAKLPMIASRLGRRVRSLGLPDLAAYCEMLRGAGGARDEIPNLIAVLTTNVSHFFREAHHFDMLRDRILPPLIDRAAAGGAIRIWSAGCSTGQEPYSIAMTLADLWPACIRHDVRILATDIDTEVLKAAREASYPAAAVAAIPERLRRAYLSPAGDGSDRASVVPDLRAMVHVRQLNLIAPWPMRRGFDVIFCRNVVIYFDQATQEKLWQRFAEMLPSGGHLMIGHSERIGPKFGDRFAPCGITAYRRI